MIKNRELDKVKYFKKFKANKFKNDAKAKPAIVKINGIHFEKVLKNSLSITWLCSGK